jgi:hypothetical protein
MFVMAFACRLRETNNGHAGKLRAMRPICSSSPEPEVGYHLAIHRRALPEENFK